MKSENQLINESKQKDLYFVAVKLFIRDGDKLLIIHDVFGEWDLPGGRIKKTEFNVPLESIIERKINEELGTEFKCEVSKPNQIFFRVERKEWGLDSQIVHIFAVGYDAHYKSGKVKLGEYHDKMEWVDINNFKPEDYFTGGWLTGVKEYLNIANETLGFS
ncbi:NUDIX hydrolase [Candidatus Saccharibacteria bacterium]|nr:NUDIX hydrolase [Candidatus Saccharibacteria bacterium]